MTLSNIFFITFFLPIAGLIFYVTPKKLRKYALLAFSIVYTFLSGIYALSCLIIFSIINYILIFIMHKNAEKRSLNTVILIISVIFNILFIPLARYNIFNGIILNVNFGKQLIYIGSSFCALSCIGTAIDVYNNKEKFSFTWIDYVIYVIYFPKLLFGPIVSYKEFVELLRKPKYSLENIGEAMILIVKGLSKKLLLADNLYKLFATSVFVFKENNEISMLSAWLGAVGFMLCLHFTLSGLTDMAVGVSMFFGIHLPRSFEKPLIGVGIQGFGENWNAPLNRWFKKYICDTMNIRSKIFEYILCILTWGLIGVWYQADLNHMLWGIAIGIAIVMEMIFCKSLVKSLSTAAYTFFLISVLWVIFMTSDIYQCIYYFKSMFAFGDIIDNHSIFWMKNYIMLILISFVVSSSLLGNLHGKLRKSSFISIMLDILSPVINIVLLVICITYMLRGNVGMTLFGGV